jgi:hypothetical protein
MPAQDGESLDYISLPSTNYQKMIRGYISPKQYLNTLKGKTECLKANSIQLSIF